MPNCLRSLPSAVACVWLTTIVLAAEPAIYHVHVNGLACPFCAYGLEKSFSRIDGVDSVSVNLKAGLIEISVKNDATLDETIVRERVEDAGFSLEGIERALPITPQDDDSSQK